MDTGVELADKRRGPNSAAPREVVPSEAFGDEYDDNDHIANHPTVRRQNNWFLLALVSCVLAFAVYVVSNVYLSQADADAVLRQQEQGDNGIGIGIKNIGTKHIGIAADSMQHTKGKAKDYLRKKIEIEEWQNATVTLKDGKRYKVLDQLTHDKSSFTEGLTYVNGRLFESVGLYQRSKLVELDPETGETMDAWPMDPKYFAEGLTYVNGKLIQLTYKKKTGFVYDFNDISAPPAQFVFDTITAEGWGMTHDAVKNEIIVSDGSAYLFFWDPTTFKELRRLKIQRQFDKDSTQINELEFWRGRYVATNDGGLAAMETSENCQSHITTFGRSSFDSVLANIWYEDTIIVINPETGVVEKEYGEFLFMFVVCH